MMLKYTFFNYKTKIVIETTRATVVRNELRYFPMS